MSIFDDLLKAVDNLNGPQNGVTQGPQGWKNQMLQNDQPASEVTTREGILDNLDNAFNSELPSAPGQPAPNLNELVVLVEGYLQMTKGLYTFLLRVGVAEKKTVKGVKDALKKVSDQVQKAKDVILGVASSDNLFLDTMETLIGTTITLGGVTFPPVTQKDFDLTQRLFERKRFSSSERRQFSLDEDKIIGELIASWETVIAGFVETNKSTTTSTNPADIALAKATAEAKFFTMHSLLEVLYDRLEANRRASADILSPII